MPKCEKCDRYPSFGYSGRKARFCKEHMEPGMVDVIHRQCEFTTCSKQPFFGHSGEVARFCAVHKEPGMVNLKSRICESELCSKHAMFNFSGEKARFCNDHKEPGMVDVVTKKCERCDCGARFGYLGNAPLRCANHMLAGMIKSPNKTCSHESCHRRALYMSGVFFHCDLHRPSAPREISGFCRMCCETVLSAQTSGLCDSCDANEHGGYGAPHQESVAELEVKDLLTHTHKPYVQVCLPSDRPHFRFDNSIILEMDHRVEYDAARIKRIYFMNNMSSLTFIRYNPNEYEQYEPPAGLARLSKSRRLELLARVLELEFSRVKPPFYGIKVLNLFYDGFNPKDMKASCDFVNPYSVD